MSCRRAVAWPWDWSWPIAVAPMIGMKSDADPVDCDAPVAAAVSWGMNGGSSMYPVDCDAPVAESNWTNAILAVPDDWDRAVAAT